MAARADASGQPFGPTTVVDLARQLSLKPYVPPDHVLPASIGDLSYDDYQAIQFKPELALGRDQSLPIWTELFHRGQIFKDRIDVAVVKDGVATDVVYSPDLFTFGPVTTTAADGDIGFSGLRLIGQLNGPGLFHEFAVFQGASYLRGIGSGQSYGLSARGLALATDQPGHEEFPIFRKFWVVQADPASPSIVVYALLDSPSVAGAYRFTVQPGSPTTMDVEATLFPRAVDLTDVGLGPGTSMFDFDANGRKNADDYRPEVHDSDGLLIQQANNSFLWRPLANPRDFSVSRFDQQAPRGFGLMQRARDYRDYEDLWAHYELQVSLWVEPKGDWGKGAVTLVEIPTGSEFFDNIVAYWRPAQPLKAGSEFSFAYRMSWGAEPTDGAEVFVNATRSGQALSDHPIPIRQFMIDFVDRDAPPATGENSPAALGFAPVLPSIAVTSDDGSVAGLLLTPLLDGTGWRAGFQLDPMAATSINLSVTLTFPDGRPAE